MTRYLRLKAPDTETGSQERAHVVTKFLTWWLGSVLVLVLVALLTNIEWARPHIEAALVQSFHREAKLGRLAWHLGLNGLTIETNRFVLEGKDGAPFIEAGKSELGVAFLPLFAQRVIIKHVSFGTPEVWAVKESSTRWNFSDLMTAGPEIHLVQIEDGTLHLINKIKGAPWKQYDLNKIDLKFGFPRKEKESWPLYFDCRVPVRRHGMISETGFKISATGTGPFEQWKKRPYQFGIEISNFNPQDFRPLIHDLPDVDGIFDVKMKGGGIFDKQMEATISGGINQLAVAGDSTEKAKLPALKLQSAVSLGSDFVIWRNANVQMQDWKVRSSGALSNPGKKLSYQATINGELGDLQGLYTRVLSRFFPTGPDGLPIRFSQPALQHNGTASVSLELSGSQAEHELASTVKASGIPMQNLLDLGLKDYAKFLPDLKPDAPVSGDIKVSLGKFNPHSAKPSPKVITATKPPTVKSSQLLATPLLVSVSDLTVPFEGTTISLNGVLNGQRQEGNVEFAIKSLEADQLKKLPKEALDDKTLSFLNSRQLKGKLDLTGKVKLVGDQRQLEVRSTLSGVSISTARGTILAKDVKGDLSFDGKTLQLDNVGGMLPCKSVPFGEFKVSGMLGASDGSIGLKLTAKQVETCKLKELAREMGVNTNLCAAGVSFDRLNGRLQDIQLEVNGKQSSPSVAFTVTNPEVQLEREDGSRGRKVFKIGGGTVEYREGRTIVKDLQVTAIPGGTLKVSARFEGSADKPNLKSAQLITDGLDLVEWRSALGPSLLPENMLEALPAAFRPVKNAPVQGRLYGDIKVSQVTDGYEADGVFGFQNVATKVGARSVALEKMTGVLAFSPKEVMFQELTGNYGRSTFSLDGVINDYRQKFNWHGQLKGSFYPDELAAISRATGTGLDLESTRKEPVALRLAGAGSATDYKLFFNGHSDPHDGLRLTVGSVDVHQPGDLPLTFDGGVHVKTESPSVIDMDKCVILAGDHTIKLQGSFKDSSAGTMADVKVTTPDAIPVAMLLGMLYPDKSFDALGQSDITLNFAGPADRLRLSGSVKLVNTNIPSLGIGNLNAKLELPEISLKPETAEDSSGVSRLTLSTAKIGGFDIHDGLAEVVTGGKQNLRISLRKGEAKIAGGKIKLNGYFEPGQAKYQAELSMAKLAVREFVDDLIKGDGKISGQADVSLTLTGEVGSGWMNSLNGKGKFSVYEGTIQTVGKLQGKLHGANLLQQGLLGFNINNFVQAVHPSKTGTFKAIDGEVSISSGVIGLKQIRYDGNDLRMRAAGEVNLPAGTVDIDVAGDIPRVATSMIPGAVGEMSREMTLQKLLGIVTFKQLEDLPSLPLLGDIASDHPRVFSFVVNAPLDKPELISKSVEKSFKWIPAKPYASAHPVPGM